MTSGSEAKVLRRLFGETIGFRARLAGLAAVDLLQTPLFLLTPVPLAIAVDSVVGKDPPPAILQSILPFTLDKTTTLIVAAVLQVLIVLAIQLQTLATYVVRTSLGEQLTLRFRSRLFRHVQRLSLRYHDSRGVTDSLYRIQYDAPSIQWIMVYGLLQLVTALATLAAMVYVTASIDWSLALIALVVCPPLYFLHYRYNKVMRPRYRREAELESSAMGVVQEVLSSFRVVTAFGRERREHDRFVEHSMRTVSQRVKLAFSESWFGLAVNVVTAVGTACVLYVGVRNVQEGVLSLGALLLVMGYLAQLYQPLQTMSQQFATFQQSLAGAERAYELLDHLPDVQERPGARALAHAAGKFELHNVSFAYEPRHDVISGLSFGLPAGSSLGIAGRTGAGKTTLVNLLLRFYDPTAGSILLDGVDLRDYRIADLRNQFALVLQEPVLFSSSIAENIAYAQPDVPFERVVDAAKAAHADEFIRALPDGYDTLVGERGMRLSGGERQRISIARAFLKDAPILVLDEPTSAVDLATEAMIMEAMAQLMRGRTTIMIAHRVGTLDTCDYVIELEHGTIGRAQRGRAAPTRVAT